ncbi:uncharacterized protein MKK02DRAFT_45684 [Dioszegia hungarica]|uniref:Uncharacterized protein n=1 Tax=Dioszegia hungarica TaxID=4972 RepID=A0AA38LX42_9TREE|nr:uncharacterized protein MKK02DRAFT_45684 [Dioszegia hungarica]KAI9636976.1 hypothetical protein MKK02DRAFT_45684 [Dioszegia hungarica]
MSAPATPVSAQASIRIRRRRYIPSPRAPLIAASSALPSSDLPLRIRQPAERTRAVSEGPTIRGIRVAFAETPVKLRELEVGWRERRKASLVLAERIQVGTPASQAEANKAAISRHGKKEREEAQRREKRLPQLKAEPKPTSSVPRSRRATVSGEPPAPRRENIPSDRITQQPTKSRGNGTGTKSGTQPVPSPQLAPPSPPPTPPPILSRSKKPDTVLAHAQQYTTRLGSQPRPPFPITSVPLPPTNRPVPLTARSPDTIHIHPAESLVGITLRLGRTSQSITITQDGRVITFSAQPVQASPRQLRLSNWANWSEEDRRDWDIVRRLIEGYKRHTPKLGQAIPTSRTSHYHLLEPTGHSAHLRSRVYVVT